MNVHVKIGGVYWGQYTAVNKEALKKKIAESIEALHPLNSSDEGAELYRQRFRGQQLYIREPHEKDYQPLN